MGVWQFTESGCVPMTFEQGDGFVSDCTWSPSGDLFVFGAVSDPLRRQVSWEHSVVNLDEGTTTRHDLQLPSKKYQRRDQNASLPQPALGAREEGDLESI